MKTDKPVKKYEPTYWNHTGELQDMHDCLFRALVPISGEAPTPAGEAVRWIAKIYYEVYNNGGYNAIDTDDWGGRTRYRLNDWYGKGIKKIVAFANLSPLEAKTLRNVLRYGEAVCDGKRPNSCRRLDEIVTKVTRAAVVAHLQSVTRPASNDRY